VKVWQIGSPIACISNEHGKIMFPDKAFLSIMQAFLRFHYSFSIFENWNSKDISQVFEAADTYSDWQVTLRDL
jgi:hypothetical protein